MMVLIWHLLLALNIQVAQVDKCAAYDWIGEHFDYQVDSQGNWNYPQDTTYLGGLTFKQVQIEKYYSVQKDRSYILVILSLEPTQNGDGRLGQHDLCSYTFSGFGLGVSNNG